MEALDSTLGAGYWSVCIQSIPFAAFHYLAGFPNGILGFSMVIIYAIMLGAIRADHLKECWHHWLHMWRPILRFSLS